MSPPGRISSHKLTPKCSQLTVFLNVVCPDQFIRLSQTLKSHFTTGNSKSTTVAPSNAPLLTVVMVTRCRLNVAVIGSQASFVRNRCEWNIYNKKCCTTMRELFRSSQYFVNFKQGVNRIKKNHYHSYLRSNPTRIVDNHHPGKEKHIPGNYLPGNAQSIVDIHLLGNEKCIHGNYLLGNAQSIVGSPHLGNEIHIPGNYLLENAQNKHHIGLLGNEMGRHTLLMSRFVHRWRH